MTRRITFGFALAFAIASCGEQAIPSRPLGEGELWLPVSRLPSSLCAGFGLDAFLRGSPTDPRITWLENEDEARVEMLVGWPPDYSARFVPRLEVLDPDGRVIARDGSRVSGACGADNGVLLEPLLPQGWYQRSLG